ncbi:MAG: hypothetical protein LBT47_00535 [Deltaproteobacteria bacterium]|nr:hypothetical protein [Deltaproteobacteria bacterium]
MWKTANSLLNCFRKCGLTFLRDKIRQQTPLPISQQDKNEEPLDSSIVEVGCGAFVLALEFVVALPDCPAAFGIAAPNLRAVPAAEGWLLVFDTNPDHSWKKIFWPTADFEGVTIDVVGC